MRHFFLTSLLCTLAWPLLAQQLPTTAAAKSAPFASAKIASHMDTPLTCWEFAWTDSTSAWDSTQQTTFTYTINGHVQEEIISYYILGAFALSQRSVNTYTADGKLSDTWLFYRNGNAWDSTIERHYRYDAFGNDTLFYERNWNGLWWETTAGEYKVLTYRNVDQIETKVGSQWSFSQGIFVRNDSVVYTYNGNNAGASDTHYGWNGSAWDPSFRWLDYVWHDYSLQLPSAARKQVFNTAWEDQERFRATYWPFNSPVAIYESYIAPNWDTTFKVDIIYDAQGHERSSEFYVYQSGWQLALGELNAYTYNGNGQTVERIRQSFDGITYLNDRKYVYDAFFVGAASPTTQSLDVQAFPNPATDRLQFRLRDVKPGQVQVQLYDLQGRLRAETRLAHAGEVIVFPISEQLENGCYHYRLTTKEGQATGKVIVQH
jgi:hypothetical protein